MLGLWFALVASCGDDTSVGTGDDSSGGSGFTGGVDDTSSSSGAGDSMADTTATPDTTAVADSTGESSTGDAETSSSGSTTAAGCENGCDDRNPCTLDECVADECDHAPIDGPAVEEAQTAGDCSVLMCVDGRRTPQNDDDDVPFDDDECTDDLCRGGVGSNPPSSAGTPCSGDGVCDGDGTCSECVGPDDCDHLPEDDDCQERTCELGICGQRFTDQGTPLQLQDDADCQVVVCDGAGGSESVADDADLPDDGLECTEDLCSDGTVSHPPLPEDTACSAGVCDGLGGCAGCNTPDDCAGTDTFCRTITCDDGVCGVDDTPAGTPLPAADQTANDCRELQCDGEGGSEPVADDEDLPVDDGNDCTGEACQAGTVDHPNHPADTDCASNGGLFCDGMGACVECNDDTQCTIADQCDVPACIANVCGQEPQAAGTACDDQLFCTFSDTCDGNGICVGDGDPCPGPDGDSNCAEACNEAADNCTGNDPNGATCDDGLFCTGQDVCNGAGTCNGGGDPCAGADGDADCSESCDEAANTCTGADPNGASCDDGLFCTVTDTCNAGACTGADNPCPGADGDGDCSEGCNEATNDCTAIDPRGSACNDGLFCTATDQCDAVGACIGAGATCAGPDGDNDCSETCDEALDDCNGNDLGGSSCDDGLFCTTTDTCNGNGACTGAGNPCPGVDGDADCTESCDETANDCNGDDPGGSACDDGSFCSGLDVCSAGTCTPAGNPCPGPDGDGDCSESCDEITGDCNGNDAATSACNDGLFCTATDQCDGAGTCAGTGDPCPGVDGDVDCSETCSEAFDDCNGNDPTNSACNDGLFCTQTDRCNNVGNCVGIGDPCPGPDGDFDCSETCNENTNNCTNNDPAGTACNDNTFCNGTDTCDAAGDCSNHTGDPCPGPDLDCDCSETCRESADACTGNDPSGSACGGGGTCNMAGVCNGMGC